MQLVVEEVHEEGSFHQGHNPLLQLLQPWIRNLNQVFERAELDLLVNWDGDRHQELETVLNEGAVELSSCTGVMGLQLFVLLLFGALDIVKDALNEACIKTQKSQVGLLRCCPGDIRLVSKHVPQLANKPR